MINNFNQFAIQDDHCTNKNQKIATAENLSPFEFNLTIYFLNTNSNHQFSDHHFTNSSFNTFIKQLTHTP